MVGRGLGSGEMRGDRRAQGGNAVSAAKHLTCFFVPRGVVGILLGRSSQVLTDAEGTWLWLVEEPQAR